MGEASHLGTHRCLKIVPLGVPWVSSGRNTATAGWAPSSVPGIVPDGPHAVDKCLLKTIQREGTLFYSDN